MMADCIPPQPPVGNATPEEWAAYSVAWGEYLKCLVSGHGNSSIASYSVQMQTYLNAVKRWQDELDE